jgi:hypothetical protein
MLFDNGSRDWRGAATNQGVPGSARSYKEARKDPPLEASKKVRPDQYLDFRLLIFKTVRE